MAPKSSPREALLLTPTCFEPSISQPALCVIDLRGRAVWFLLRGHLGKCKFLACIVNTMLLLGVSLFRSSGQQLS